MRNSTKFSSLEIPHVGRGTPTGEWFRRYWIVVGTTRDLRDIPQGRKILGEELVLFRDEAGRLGLIGKHCPHRGASLEYGDIEDGGIRCPYHGWLFDVRGQCLEMPAEPKESQFPQKVKHLSYPVREQGGFIFAYLGPEQEDPPPLPKYGALADPAGQRSLEATRVYDYNWFNFIENGADPAHFSILHRADPNDGTWRSWFFNFRDVPPFDAVETSYGMKVISRKPGPTADTEYVDEKSFRFAEHSANRRYRVYPLQTTTRGSERGIAQRAFHVRYAERRSQLYAVYRSTITPAPIPSSSKSSRRAEEWKPRRRGSLTTGASIRPLEAACARKTSPARAHSRCSISARSSSRPRTSGVILIRKIILNDIESVQENHTPKGVLQRSQAQELVNIDSFTGVRGKGSR